MLNYEFTLSLVFRLLNFGFLASILTYLINKYVVVSIRRAIAHRKSSLSVMEQQYLELQRKEQVLEVDMQQQEQLASELLKKVVIWKNKVEQQQQYDKTESIRSAQTMVQHVELQKKALEAAELRKAVFPLAIAHAESELRQKFTEQNNGARYVHTVVKSLEHA